MLFWKGWNRRRLKWNVKENENLKGYGKMKGEAARFILMDKSCCLFICYAIGVRGGCGRKIWVSAKGDANGRKCAGNPYIFQLQYNGEPSYIMRRGKYDL